MSGFTQQLTRKQSPLGKEETPLAVVLGTELVPGGRAAEGTAIHMITDKRQKMPRALRQTLNITREVLCELGGGLQEREKLDVILMGAALAILSVTAKEVGGGGGA